MLNSFWEMSGIHGCLQKAVTLPVTAPGRPSGKGSEIWSMISGTTCRVQSAAGTEREAWVLQGPER